MKMNQILKEVENGQVPDNLEVKCEYIQELNRVSTSISPFIAILIASAKRENFPGNSGNREWLKWGNEHFNYNDAYIYQMYRVGLLLLQYMTKDKSVYKDLLTFSFGKLNELTKFKETNELESFMENNNISELSRDAVRDAVNQELGETTGKKLPKKKNEPMIPGNQLWQPEFYDIINETAAWDEDFTSAASLDERIDPWISARGGLSLIDISIRRIKGGAKLQQELKEAIIDTLEKDIEELRSLDQEN